MAAHNHLLLPFQGIWWSLLTSTGTRHVHSAYICRQTFMCIKIKIIKRVPGDFEPSLRLSSNLPGLLSNSWGLSFYFGPQLPRLLRAMRFQLHASLNLKGSGAPEKHMSTQTWTKHWATDLWWLYRPPSEIKAASSVELQNPLSNTWVAAVTLTPKSFQGFSLPVVKTFEGSKTSTHTNTPLPTLRTPVAEGDSRV